MRTVKDSFTLAFICLCVYALVYAAGLVKMP